jgi:predicted outer membrane lipoprotein
MTPAHHWLIGTILADLDNVTTALYRTTEKAQQMGIDLNLEKMEQRAKEFNEK